jgi:hypothetical protein
MIIGSRFIAVPWHATKESSYEMKRLEIISCKSVGAKSQIYGSTSNSGGPPDMVIQ